MHTEDSFSNGAVCIELGRVCQGADLGAGFDSEFSKDS